MGPEIPRMPRCSQTKFSNKNKYSQTFARGVVDCFVASLAADKSPAVPSLGTSDMQLQCSELIRHPATSLLH
jgi:hypothetical protein